MPQVVLTDEQLNKIQNIALEMLIELDRICRKYELKYTLGFGTLLGAIRHKGFIPWDDDVDVWMKREDLKKFREICKTELNSKYFYQTNETDKNYFLLIDKIRANGTIFEEEFYEGYDMHQGVYIDIFPIDNISDSPLSRWWQMCAYRVFKTGVQVKYLKTSVRKGKKRVLASILKILYAPFPLEYMHKKATRYAEMYMGRKGKYVSDLFYHTIYDSAFFATFIDAEFCGNSFKISPAFETILRMRYGDYMQLPPEKERVPRHHLCELKL